MEKTVFAAGCFWGVEEDFSSVAGVVSTRVGYTGGKTENPSYQDVCTHTTGHAEAVEVVFDPEILSFDQLLKVFWNCHDPTQLNRQGPDVGDQYRSAIFYTSEEQRSKAEASRDLLNASGRFRRSIATQIVPAGVFWEAEEYHQHYHRKNGGGCGF